MHKWYTKYVIHIHTYNKMWIHILGVHAGGLFKNNSVKI